MRFNLTDRDHETHLGQAGDPGPLRRSTPLDLARPERMPAMMVNAVL
jgi:hypothetical protein